VTNRANDGLKAVRKTWTKPSLTVYLPWEQNRGLRGHCTRRRIPHSLWTMEGTQVADWLQKPAACGLRLKLTGSPTLEANEEFAQFQPRAAAARSRGGIRGGEVRGRFAIRTAGRKSHDGAWTTGRRAIELVRSTQREGHPSIQTKVGILGFSAGGYVAHARALDHTGSQSAALSPPFWLLRNPRDEDP